MTSQLANVFAAEAQGGSSIIGILIILLPLGAVLYLTMVPQRKARQRQADLQRNLAVGDEVLTTGGIIGVITFAEDDIYHLEIDNDVVIRIAKSAVARSTAAEPDKASQPASRTRKGLLGSGSKSDDSSDADDTTDDTTDDVASSDADGDASDADGTSPKTADDK